MVGLAPFELSVGDATEGECPSEKIVFECGANHHLLQLKVMTFRFGAAGLEVERSCDSQLLKVS
jgi:hypothetical protein